MGAGLPGPQETSAHSAQGPHPRGHQTFPFWSRQLPGTQTLPVTQLGTESRERGGGGGEPSPPCPHSLPLPPQGARRWPAAAARCGATRHRDAMETAHGRVVRGAGGRPHLGHTQGKGRRHAEARTPGTRLEMTLSEKPPPGRRRGPVHVNSRTRTGACTGSLAGALRAAAAGVGWEQGSHRHGGLQATEVLMISTSPRSHAGTRVSKLTVCALYAWG